jgi:RNA polymerase sigma-70 factor, ECF subfamily
MDLVYNDQKTVTEGNMATGVDGEENSEEATLLRRWVENADRQALASLFARVARPAWAIALRLTGDSHMADDAVQQGFLAAVHRAKPRHCRRAVGWVLAVVANAARMERRAAESRRRLAASAPPPEPVGEPAHDDASRLVPELLAQLPEHERLAVTLHFIDRLSVPQVAAALRRRPGTVHMQLRRGLEHLRALFAQHGQSLGGGAALVALMQSSLTAAEPPTGAAIRWTAVTNTARAAGTGVFSGGLLVTGIIAAGLVMIVALTKWHQWNGGQPNRNPIIAPVISPDAIWQSPPLFDPAWLDRPVALVLWDNTPVEILDHIARLVGHTGKLPAALPRSWWFSYDTTPPRVTWNVDGDLVVPLHEALNEVAHQLGGAWLVSGGRLVLHRPLDPAAAMILSDALDGDRADTLDDVLVNRAAEDLNALRAMIFAALSDRRAIRGHRATLIRHFLVKDPHGYRFDEMRALASAFADDPAISTALRAAPMDELAARLAGVLRERGLADRLQPIATRGASEITNQARRALARIADPGSLKGVIGKLVMSEEDPRQFLSALGDSEQTWVVEWLHAYAETALATLAESENQDADNSFSGAVAALASMPQVEAARALLDIENGFQQRWNALSNSDASQSRLDGSYYQLTQALLANQARDRSLANEALSRMQDPQRHPRLRALAMMVRRGGLGESLEQVVPLPPTVTPAVDAAVLRQSFSRRFSVDVDAAEAILSELAKALAPAAIVSELIDNPDTRRWLPGARVLAEDQRPATVRTAMAALARHRANSPRGRALLIGLANSRHPAARQLVRSLLGTFTELDDDDKIDPDVAAAIARNLAGELSDPSVAALLHDAIVKSPDPLVRRAVIAAIGFGWSQSAPEHLVGALRQAAEADEDAGVRGIAVRWWLRATGESHFHQRKGDESLVANALQDKAGFVRASALHALRSDGVKTMNFDLTKRYFGTDGVACSGSGSLDRYNRSIDLAQVCVCDIRADEPGLITLMHDDPDAQVRMYAAIWHPGGSEPLLAAAERDESPEVRATAIHMLGKHLVISKPAERPVLETRLRSLRSAESDPRVLQALDHVLGLKDTWQLQIDPPRLVTTEEPLQIPRAVN